MDEAVTEYISQIFKALSSKERVSALELFNKGELNLMEIANNVGMSRSGFQNIVNDFRNAGLIEQIGHRSFYKLTFKGKTVLDLTNRFSQEMAPIEKEYREKKIRQTISKFGAGLSREEIMKILENTGFKNAK